jgi:hypothetical protein
LTFGGHVDSRVYATAVLNLFVAATQSRMAFTYKEARSLEYQDF